MPTKVRSRKLKRISTEDQEYLLIELDRVPMYDGKYTVIVYDIADGDLEDLATNIERRMATFEHPPSVLKHEGEGRWGWEGLDGAMIDVELETVQEEDEGASSHRELDQRIQDRTESGYYGGNLPTAEQQERFWEAVETVALDETDEDAWAVIDAWRSRQLRSEER